MSTPQNEWLTAHLEHTYPFTEQPSDSNLERAIVDMHLSFDRTLEVDGQCIMEDFAYRDAGGGNRSLEVEIKNNSVEVFDTANAGVTQAKTDIGDWEVWRLYDPVSASHLTIIFSQEKIDDWETQIGGGDIEFLNINLPIVTKAISHTIPQLDTLQIIDATGIDGTPVNTTIDVGNPVTFQSGFNINQSLVVDDTDIKEDNIWTLNAVPGGGIGRYEPDCVGTSSFIRSINGIGPDRYGNFNWSASGCHWLEVDSNDIAGGEFNLHNDCVSCLQCDDVFAAYDLDAVMHAFKRSRPKVSSRRRT